MEYTSLVDTSLDLNSNPLQFLKIEPAKQEVHSNLIEFGLKMVSQPAKDEAEALVEELNRVNGENKKLTEMLTVMCENYNALQKKLADYMIKNPGSSDTTINNNNIIASRKRKGESIVVDRGGISEESSSSDEDSCSKKPREQQQHIKSKLNSRVYVRTQASDTTSLVVKDGYQWRKYGQKVTRDNPSPRAYFKCSFAPTCPVKKKVQRSVEDQSVLVATYEGEHNHHPHPSRPDHHQASPSGGSNHCVVTPNGWVPSSALTVPTITLDLTSNSSSKPSPVVDAHHQPKVACQRVDSPDIQQILVDQMATSLTKDPSFKAALAAAISGRMMLQTQKW